MERCKACPSLFTLLVFASQALGLASVILVCVWMINYRGGFGWKTPAEFNYHPLFMVIGLIFLYGDAILVYRVFSGGHRLVLKIFHMIMQLCALGFATFSLVIVFDFHIMKGFPHMYSLHSWIGLTTVVLFALQFVIGFGAYLFPKFGHSLRNSYVPLHRYWGVAIYCLAVVSALIGITEKTLFSIASTYSDLPSEAYAVNFLGITLVVNGAIVTYLVTSSKYRRRLYSEDSEEIGLVG